MTFEEIKRRIITCQSSELDLSDCSLVDDDVTKMISVVNQHANITKLNLSYNRLSSGVFKSLLDLSHVKELNLADNNIDQIDERLIAPGKFTAINLRSNNIPVGNVVAFLKAHNNQHCSVQFGFEGNPGFKNSLSSTSNVVIR